MTNQHREENDRVLCSALQRYAQEESSNLPNAEELAGVTFRFLYKGIIINHNKNRANLH